MSPPRPLVEVQGRAKKRSDASNERSTSASSPFAIARVAETNFQPRRELPPTCPNQAPSPGSQSAKDELQGPHPRGRSTRPMLLLRPGTEHESGSRCRQGESVNRERITPD